MLPVSVDSEKIAIQGYDTVAYFTDGKAVKGSSAFESKWMGSRWQFANAEHRDMFTQNPDAYAPRFGGYCVMAMVNGEIFRANPLAWVIIDGKLYLNSAPGDAVAFQRRSAEYIQKAEETWKAVNQ
ncbi:YHS domain-containing (seleno)protein [Ferirhizobium litorale]|uniref:YHS domain-containing (seleno)protein n=1 Tax=Ferirhizobium litorale TaxID=2927786 RepID=UPI0028930D44|nr:YHS domain-containing (seleno)protein [Fererhizobium litorale]